MDSDELDGEAPIDPDRPANGPDELTDEPDATAANYNMSFSSALHPDGDGISVTWETSAPPVEYEICWKEASQGGSVCGHNSIDFEVNVNNGGYSQSAGTQTIQINNLECETEYKIRIKRNWYTYDTEYFTTGNCTCADPCPQGGWYDGANCYMGSAPSGTNAFIWNNNYYHSAQPGNQCPLPGTWYDGANCFVDDVPPGVTPFIWSNNWYYASCP